MSTENHTDLFMPSMTIIGGAKPFQRFIGPDRAAERETLKHNARMPSPEYSMAYFVHTEENRLLLCYFNDARLSFMHFEYPFYKRYWRTLRDGRVIGYQDEFAVVNLLEYSGRLPNERITMIEQPRLPVTQPRSEAEVRYGDPPYIIVMGKLRYQGTTDEKTYIFPCVYLGVNQWHNRYLVDELAYATPESWCYLEDLLVPLDPA